ncbi:glycoside hydrolase family 5 [Penicillium samsonianum]|uniref:glycoside hydrolase family 5 n=1 Tax=Penicillium samsonianum TaxID=1882272 RepID=UPI0025493A88|nr:glycoside hydrolase family 5 [Penicillium samsonianum]KAJ6133668.1 glycoside hydrolase family 5 [Penicillium samsonianum]
MKYPLSSVALFASSALAWLPEERDLAAFNISRFDTLEKRFQPTLPNGVSKIRGVNFGGWLVSEPWMMSNEWNNVMGCNGAATEFDCMKNQYSGSNRENGNAKFANHWRDWINPATVQSVHDVGLNTIRIPIGYWSYVDIVDKASEPFADGSRMLPYLDAVVGKAADLGLYVIIDFHGAPGGQQQDAFTGQMNVPAGFYNAYNFGRAEKWLSWMTNRIHTNNAYRSVGMIEVLNEPVSRHDGGGRYPAPGEDPGLVQSYYPDALKAVRDAEASLGVANDRKLHVQFMSSKWDSGDARTNPEVKNDLMTAYDDHNYIGFALSGTSDQGALMNSACHDSRVVSGQDFTITGEWSMTSGADWHDANFFKKWFTAQQQLYEKPGMSGWVYWTWKTELNDPRWTYSYATSLGYVPTTAAELEKNVFQQVC